MAWYADAGFTKRRKLTISSAAVSSALTNYPAYIDLRACGDVLANIRPDARDLIFTAGDETTLLKFEVVRQKLFGGRGVTSWFSRPNVIHDATTNQTIGGFVHAGDPSGTPGDGNIVANAFDHDTNAFTSFILNNTFAGDDHSEPAFLKLPSGKFLAGYCSHNVANNGPIVRRSTTAGSIAAWDAEVVVATAPGTNIYSYCQLAQMSSQGGRIYCFYRINNTSWAYKTSDDDGATWGGEVIFWQPGGGQPYINIDSNGVDRIDVLCSRDVGNTPLNGCFHFYIDADTPTTVKYRHTNGTEIVAAMPWNGGAVTAIYDGFVTGKDCWIYDIRTDGATPQALLVRFESTSDHRYMHAKWSGAAWVVNDITNAGTNIDTSGASNGYYSGGLCFDGNDTNVVWLSRQETQHELQKWTTSDGGTTWTKAEDCTTGTESGMSNFRPRSPKGYPAYSPYQVVFSSGPYVSFSIYTNTYFVGYPGAALEAYVKVPSVSNSANTDIYLYYDKAAQTTDLSDVANVWDTGYKMVAHLSHRPGSVAYPDATTNATLATRDGVGSKEPVSRASSFGGGVEFNGTAADGHLTLGTQTSVNMANWTGVTVEAAINLNPGGASNAERVVFSNGVTGTTAGVLFRIEPGGSPAHKIEGHVTRATDIFTGGTFNNAVPTSALSHVGLTFDSATLRCYINGTQEATTYPGASALDNTPSAAGYIGSQSDSLDGFSGTIEEIRISDVGRSAAWMGLTAASYTGWGGVFTVGSEQTPTTSHDTTGVLQGAGAAVAGSAARTRVHPSSGALGGAGAAVAGSAERITPSGEHSTTGALAGGGAAVNGEATRVPAAVTHETSGALSGGGGAVAGVAEGPATESLGGSYPKAPVRKLRWQDYDVPLPPEVAKVEPAPVDPPKKNEPPAPDASSSVLAGRPAPKAPKQKKQKPAAAPVTAAAAAPAPTPSLADQRPATDEPPAAPPAAKADDAMVIVLQQFAVLQSIIEQQTQVHAQFVEELRQLRVGGLLIRNGPTLIRTPKGKAG